MIIKTEMDRWMDTNLFIYTAHKYCVGFPIKYSGKLKFLFHGRLFRFCFVKISFVFFRIIFKILSFCDYEIFNLFIFTQVLYLFPDISLTNQILNFFLFLTFIS